jgi:SAM-dependent methyltransferase
MTYPLNCQMHRHPDTWITLQESGTDRRFSRPYMKTFDYLGDFINNEHYGIASCSTKKGMIDLGIEGWLLIPDALKLYEMVYFSAGDVLELGPYRGLSTSIIAHASAAGTPSNAIVSVDLDAGAVDATRQNLSTHPARDRVHLFVFDAFKFVENLATAQRRFDFCFIDHSHAYSHVRDVCQALDKIIVPGGFCLFHDFNDPRNADASATHYGVYQGVTEGLDMKMFEFWGVYGCTGLYRRLTR